MPRKRKDQDEYPPLLRFILWIGRPLGIAFVPQNHVQVLYRMGKYAGCVGPGLVYYNKFTETLGPQVYIGGIVNDYVLDNVVSRDVLPVTMHVSATVAYDPKEGHELADVLTRIPRDAYASIAGTYIRWALLAIANQYNASELTQFDVRSHIERAVRDVVNDEQRFLGLKLLGKLRITRVELPASLTDRHAVIAQRRASILAGTEFHPAEYRRALVSEVLEQLGQRGTGDAFVNFGEMLEAYASEHPASLPQHPNIIEVPPQALEDKGAPPPPPQQPPPAANREDRPPRRPRSRL
jgi:hypothetical protein